MAVPIWPISAMRRPIDQTLEVQAVVNSFGYPYEQRIVTSLPYGPRESGVIVTGASQQRTYVGRNKFAIGIPRIKITTMPVSGNANLDNSLMALWDFYLDRFYNPTTLKVQWEAFYWYDPLINDDTDTWLGDTADTGLNSRGETVTNVTGRYLVRFAEASLSRSWFIYCLTSFELELIEVAA